MKNMENRSGRRWGRKAIGSLVTTLVVAAVILLNVLVSSLGQANVWQADVTIDRFLKDDRANEPLSLYTLTQPFKTLIKDSAIPFVDQINAERVAKGEEKLKINIIFCTDRDIAWESDTMRHPLYTALQLQKAFPEQINVSFIDIRKNPSAVQKYKATSSTKIYSSNIIFEFGTEYRIYTLSTLFITNSGESTPWAYNGEKHFANAILAVTRAESPVACFLTNHGERVEDCQGFRQLVEKAGYIVKDLDLEKDPIPEDCRMLICYDPQTDFYAYGSLGETGTSEIQKLDEYLDGCFSFMLFIDNDTPELPNLEEYLTEWGVTVARAKDDEGNLQNYTVRDTTQKLDKDGYTLIADYATEGLGASITTDMRGTAYPSKVIFPNATAIKMSDSYHYKYVEADETAGTEAYRMGQYYRNASTRYFTDVFLGGQNAVAEIGGETYEITTAQDAFRLMTLTCEDRIRQETNYFSQSDRSFVCVFGSTEFASDEVLSSAAYGNADVLFASLLVMGREVSPASIDLRAFKIYNIKYEKFTESTAVSTTLCLVLIPPVICFGAGVLVTVKRKNK